MDSASVRWVAITKCTPTARPIFIRSMTSWMISLP